MFLNVVQFSSTSRFFTENTTFFQTRQKWKIVKFADCTVETAEMAPETVSTEALSRLRDLRNVQNSQKTPSTHPIWHMQRFISHNARQTRSGTQQFSVFTL